MHIIANESFQRGIFSKYFMDVLASKAQPMQMRAIDIISVLLFYQNVEVCLMLFLVKLNIEKKTQF